MNWLLIFAGENNFYCLFNYVGVKLHLPLIGPGGDVFQVLSEGKLGCIDVGYFQEKGRVVCKKLNV